MRAVIFIYAALLAFALAGTCGSQSTPTKTVHQDEFSIAGIEVRTSGEVELTADGLIPGLWQKFYQEHVLEKIPNKADGRVYAAYTDYARDRNGEYTVVIGARVKQKTEAPTGMVLKTIPAGQYAVLSSETGPAATVISQAWLRIAALEDKDQLGGKRAYKADYEVYPSAGMDPQSTHADVYVGLK